MKVDGLNKENVLREKSPRYKKAFKYETTNPKHNRVILNETREIENEATITKQSNLTNNAK